ncbi:Peptidase family M23 [Duganella sacchari]|uniref:Peptidase family M23 n=1 Tax=Duganella sacchari TaxID=551987 RepID=A0A1M7QQC1_9BURK|nr:M56 family metallopeptidase [Duganella sacchari]SHN33614.1 Peptidase family M23 [Duganella sacchari]
MMTLLSIKWLFACAGSLAAGLLVRLILSGAARRWPALHTRRAVWLAAQGVVAIAALLPFLPRSAPFSMAPPIILDAPAPDAPAAAQAADMAAASSAAPHDAPASLAQAQTQALGAATSSLAVRALPHMATLWLLLYAVGLLWSLAKRLRGRRVWRRLLAAARPLSPGQLQTHAAFTATQRRDIAAGGLTVMYTEAAVSPMLIGVRTPRLLLPAHMNTLTLEQQQMIVAHELQHWRAHDPFCLAIASALQTICWFNPMLRWMARQMEWALELNCDQQVLNGRPQHQRKQYAQALLQLWSAMAPLGVAAFNGATITARIRHMQKDGLPALSSAATWLIAATFMAMLVAGAWLQPALAYTVPTAVAPIPAATTRPADEPWRAPVDKVRVTSFFGVMRSVLPTPHKGIDFAAAKGTPVHATASGTVIEAGAIRENEGRYGTGVIIDHGGQQSLYAHLDSVSVRPGQHVTAGQLIGKSGASGFATGPHLHLEVRANGHLVDPASRLANLDAYATPRALNIRRQQLKE